MRVYVDTESAGLKGPLHTIQYSINRQPIKIIRCSDPFTKSQGDDYTNFISFLYDPCVILVGFNLGFDLEKLYQWFGVKIGVLQPFKCQTIDLYQKTLTNPPLCYFPLVGGKAIIKLSCIPNAYEEQLKQILVEKMREVLPPIALIEVKRSAKKEIPTVCTLEFKVRIPAKLKELVKLFLPEELKREILLFKEVLKVPNDFGWKENKRFPWITEEEIPLYQEVFDANEKILDDPNSPAYTYITKDVEYLWYLEDWLESFGADLTPDFNDTCTHIVAFTKVFGFGVDQKKAQELSDSYAARMKEIEGDLQINVQSSQQRVELLRENLLEELKPLADTLITSTGKPKLSILLSEGLLTPRGEEIARELLEYKPLAQRRKQLEILIASPCGKVFPDFRVLGTGTNRMGGRGGFNFQGIAREGDIRQLFYTSSGGDYDNLEVMIAAQLFGDKELQKDILSGVDLHTKTCSLMFPDKFPGLSYQDLMEIKSNPSNSDYKKFKEYRHKAKGINFAILYFAGAFKIASILECTPEEAEEKLNENFFSCYPSLLKTREVFFKNFCTADFTTWDKTSVSRMKDCVGNLFGIRKYIVFEKFVANFLWSETEKISSVAKGDSRKVDRKKGKGPQPMQQAIRSSLLGAASTIQKSLYRQLGNYPIQSTGAILTKKLMTEVWNKHHVPMMNVHDEILIPSGFEDDIYDIQDTIQKFLEKWKKEIPGLNMDFIPMQTWADKQ